MNKLNVGVIGVGYMGINHLRVYSELNNCNIVGVVDASKKALENAAIKFNVKTYDDLEKFLNENKLDAASVAVPTSKHYEVAKMLIERGVHVLVEKPFTDSIECAQSLVNLAKKNTVKIMVGYIERFNPVIQKIKSILTEDIKKEMFHCSIRRLNTPSRSDDSAVLDLSTHDIDLLHYLFGDLKAITASAVSHNNIEKHVVTVLKLNNGCNALLESSLLYPIKIREINIATPNTLIHGNLFGRELSIHLKRNINTENNFGDIDYSTLKPTLENTEPLKLELSHFLECVRESKTPSIGGEEALKTLKVAFEIMKMTREGV